MNRTHIKLKNDIAYAEGRHARFIGASLSSNPWPAEFTEEYNAWQLGYAVGDSVVDNTCYSGATGLPGPTMLRLLAPAVAEELIRRGEREQRERETNIPAPTPDGLYTWSIEAIKALLNGLQVSYPADADKPTLIALVPKSHHQTAGIHPDTPSNQNTKAEIKVWLDQHGVTYPHDATKDNLLFMVHEAVLIEHGLPLD